MCEGAHVRTVECCSAVRGKCECRGRRAGVGWREVLLQGGTLKGLRVAVYRKVKANAAGRDFVVGDIHGMFDSVERCAGRRRLPV